MKCEQCGFLVDSLPEGGGEYLCPNCGWVMRKGPPAVPGDGQPSPTDTATNTHLKIAKTVNVGFGDFASVLAATDASKIVSADARHDEPEHTRTATGSTLNVEAPDDDDVLTPLDVYDEDDEYARIQAEIASRTASLDARAAELDNREKYLNRKLDEIIAEKEFLRTGIEKTDAERASYLKQKSSMDAQRADFEKEMAARKASLDARAAEIEKKTEAMNKTRASLEELKMELNASLGEEQDVDHTTSSVSIPYSAKLLRQNNKLARVVRIQERILIGLGVLAVVLIVLLFMKESELRRARTAPEQKPPAPSVGIIGGADGPTAVFLNTELIRKSGQSAESVSAPSADAPNIEQKHPSPETQSSGGGL